jgi:hypothetical protein
LRLALLLYYSMSPARIYNLVYSSEASAPMSVEELQALLRQARAHNQEQRVTGMLFYSEGQPGTSGPGNFFQVLEGSKEAVQEVIARIKLDPRHTNLQILIEGSAAQRMFPDWSMGFVTVIPPDMEALTGYVDPRQPRFLLPRAHAISPELLALMQSLLADYPTWPYPSV